MKPRLILTTCALLCLSIFFSCDKKKGEPVPVTEPVHVFDNDFIGLDRLMPELEIYDDIQYDEQMGYFVSFREEEWEHILALSPVFIPAQSAPCSFKAGQAASGWEADASRQIILSDIGLPGGSSYSDLIRGECDGVFKMNLSLGENVPYRKVTLTDFTVTFPEWFRAKAEST